MGSKDLIIIGTGHSRDECPYDCETWGLCGIYGQREYREEDGLPFRMDKVFITDTLFSPEGALHFDLERINRLKRDYGTEVISMHPLKLGRFKVKTTRYPIEKIISLYRDYFSSTIAYALAYALYKDYKKVSLYGVDLHAKQEYFIQKACVEYWLGRFEQNGGEVFVAEGSLIFKTPNYTRYGQKRKIDYKKVDPYGLTRGNRDIQHSIS